jgi:hypothetical protein
MKYRYIKLTRADGKTHNNMQWDVGVTNRATGTGYKLCTDGVLHVYDTPEQAEFIKPVQVPNYTRAWIVESDDEGVTDGTKRGVKSCTVIEETTLPEITTEQRVEIAIRCALTVYDDPSFVEWAEKWLSGADRTKKSVDTVECAVRAEGAYAAADAAADTYAAAYADAHAACDVAAYAAAYDAYDAAAHAHAAVRAAYGGAAAEAAAYAAYAAAYAKLPELKAIITEVLGKEKNDER